jgi:hypothetical protein
VKWSHPRSYFVNAVPCSCLPGFLDEKLWSGNDILGCILALEHKKAGKSVLRSLIGNRHFLSFVNFELRYLVNSSRPDRNFCRSEFPTFWRVNGVKISKIGAITVNCNFSKTALNKKHMVIYGSLIQLYVSLMVIGSRIHDSRSPTLHIFIWKSRTVPWGREPWHLDSRKIRTAERPKQLFQTTPVFKKLQK